MEQQSDIISSIRALTAAPALEPFLGQVQIPVFYLKKLTSFGLYFRRGLQTLLINIRDRLLC
ncbi:hypothetical protein [Sphingobacterium faecale]|uniref:Uncharacterized protein n=1 Tax=Sphingobacterium faecale TaxID=2803775 RepID=A0ABS1R8M0_9SPHI|nr:hypothetical protein [Sphingobacterium faecale]MBL1411066.1 hypothetical protein [Sphingobacterium faecale]